MPDADIIKKLAALPWASQVVLASGYCAYLVAYMGIRYNHKAADTIFASLAFGLVALFVLWTPIPVPDRWHAVIAFAASISAGVVWRAVLRNLLRWIANRLHYSWADDTTSAWDRLQEGKSSPSQISVETGSGWIYSCHDASAAGPAAFGPFVLGTSGDVLIYADHVEDPKMQERAVSGVLDAVSGDLVTYIPKDQVRRITIRYDRPTFPGVKAAGKVAASWAWVASKLRRRPPEG